MAVKQQETTEEAVVEPKKKKRRVLLIFIIILLVLILLGAVFTGYAYFTKSFFFAPNDGQEEKVKIIDEVMYPLDSFVINLGSDGIRKYLKVTLSIGCVEKKDTKKLAEKEVQIRDIIISTLRNQDIEIISSVDGEDVIKDEIEKSINILFEPDLAINIYFTEYIIQ